MALTWTITTRGSYGFSYDSGTGYYVSNNKGVHSSAAVSRLNFSVSGGRYHLYLDCISYGESNYDYGLLSKINCTLGTSSSVDSSSLLQYNFYGRSSSSVRTIDYGEIDSNCFIDIKYRKDSSVNSGNDNFKVKIRYVLVGYQLAYDTDGGVLESGYDNPTLNVTTLPSTLPVCTKTGYLFEGWFTDSDLTIPAVAGSAITANTTLYAKYKLIDGVLDLSSIWPTLQPQTYVVKAKAKLSGYRDSRFSNAASFTVYPLNETLQHLSAKSSNPLGVPQWVDSLQLQYDLEDGYDFYASNVVVTGATKEWTVSGLVGTLSLSNIVHNNLSIDIQGVQGLDLIVQFSGDAFVDSVFNVNGMPVTLQLGQNTFRGVYTVSFITGPGDTQFDTGTCQYNSESIIYYWGGQTVLDRTLDSNTTIIISNTVSEMHGGGSND